jgi:hypothetical protein
MMAGWRQPGTLRGSRPFRALSLLAALLLMLGVAQAVAAQGRPDRAPAFLYATTYYDGLAYGSAFVPPGEETIYMLAGRANVLSPRDTLIYFWPITNRYVADWNARNEVAEGTLEILQQGEVVDSLALQQYVVQYDSNAMSETLRLHVGSDAEANYTRFESLRQDYQHALFEYHRTFRIWRTERDEALLSGEVTEEDLPPAPVMPPPFSLFSTVPNRGFIVQLSPGRYQIQFRLADGSIMPTSRKQIVVFEPQRQGISYDVVPERRWTRHEQSDHPDSVVYALPDTVMYLQPHRQHEYNELFHTRMEDPQAPIARADRAKWVRHEPAPATTMIATSAQASPAAVTRERYAVIQLAGPALGYEVVPLAPGQSTSTTFEGFRLALQGGRAAYTVHMVDEAGMMIPGSARELRVLDTGWVHWLYLLSALPLLVGIGRVVLRRRQTRRVTTPNA